MNPFMFMVFVLPIWLMKEGYQKLGAYIHEEKWYWKLPYILLIIVMILLTVLWVIGVI